MRHPSVGELADNRLEQAIVGLLMQDDDTPLWSIDEVVREIGDEISVVDALRRLEAVGLVHSVDASFVFVSRTARRAFHLAD